MEHARPPAWLAIEERKDVRQPGQVVALISGMDFADEPVTITDFSTLGCRVVAARNVKLGTYLTLKLPAFTSIEGWVAWSKIDTFGLDFSHPLRKEVVAHVLGRTAARLLG